MCSVAVTAIGHKRLDLRLELPSIGMLPVSRQCHPKPEDCENIFKQIKLAQKYSVLRPVSC